MNGYVGELTCPVGELTRPVGELTRPDSEWTNPVGELTRLVGELTHLVGKLTRLVGELTRPAGEVTRLVGEFTCAAGSPRPNEQGERESAVRSHPPARAQSLRELKSDGGSRRTPASNRRLPRDAVREQAGRVSP